MDIQSQKMIVEKKLRALCALRQSTVDGFKKFELEIVKIESQTRNFSMAIDMAAAVATPVALAARSVFTNLRSFHQGAIAVAQAEKEILKAVASRAWGIGATPIGSGVVQGATQVIVAGQGFAEPQVNEGLVIAYGKIVTQSFLDMWSPSFWATKIAGDPKLACQRVRQLNIQNQAKAMKQIDESIAKWTRIQNALSRGIDVTRLA